MSSALRSDMGGMLSTMIEAQRGMTDAEVYTYLTTGELPDLSRDPLDEGGVPDETPVLSEGEVLAWLSGVTAAGGFSAPSETHYELPNGQVLTFRFNPNQPRDDEGKWTDTGIGGADVDLPGFTSSGKKVTPAVIYKKHADGTVVGVSGDGQQRVRWSADRKKFVTERRNGAAWKETAALTKSAAYEDAKKPGKWFEPSDEVSEVAPAAPAKKLTTPGKTARVEMLLIEDAKSVLAEVEGDDERAKFTRNALEAYDEFGPNVATIYVARDEVGRLTGAAAVVDHIDPDELGGLTPYSLIDYVGSLSPGAGTELVKQARRHADDNGTTLYAEPTQSSAGFWEKQGFVPDPLGEGVHFYGPAKIGTNQDGSGQATSSESAEQPPALVEPAGKPAQSDAAASVMSSLATATERAADMQAAYDAGYAVEKRLTGGNSAQFVRVLKLSNDARVVNKMVSSMTIADEGRREYLGGRVLNALGIDDVVTVQLNDHEIITTHIDGETGARALADILNGPGTAKERTERWLQRRSEFARSPGGREIGLYDWLANNTDRHEGNWIVMTDGRVRPIDQGSSQFETTTYADYKTGKLKQLETNSPFAAEWLGLKLNKYNELVSLKPKFTKTELADVRKRLESVRDDFSRPGEDVYFANMLDRLAQLERKVKK